MSNAQSLLEVPAKGVVFPVELCLEQWWYPHQAGSPYSAL